MNTVIETPGTGLCMNPADARDFSGPALVLGLGSSGVAAARLLRARGVAVTALDEAEGPDPRAAADLLRREGVDARAGAKGALPKGPFGMAVASPGLSPATSPWLAELRARGTPIWAEFELGWRLRGAARVIAVTGSNGKSSAVKLIAESLVNAGHSAAACGNYGVPLCDQAMRPPVDFWVAEISSFQLELARAFAPDTAVLLNIQPNHLDRHGTMDAYRAAKARIFAHLPGAATAIVPPDLASLAAPAHAHGARVWTFGAAGDSTLDYAWRKGQVQRPSHRAPVGIHECYFDNPILGMAAAASVAAVESVGVEGESVGRAAPVFEPLPHRMQAVGEARGVRWINDSKATSLAALHAALRMMGEGHRIRLLAGGRPKEYAFDSVNNMLASCARKVYLFGECAGRLQDAWQPVVPVSLHETLDSAAMQAADDAERGDVILLSPACTSFDQFRNFEARGEAFTRLARRWCTEHSEITRSAATRTKE